MPSARLRPAFLASAFALLASAPDASAQVSFSSTAYPVSTDTRSVATDDFNGDGKLDLVATTNDASQKNLKLLLGNGAGGFGAPTAFAAGGTGVGVGTGDLNNDGKADVAVTNGFEGTVTVLLGTGAGGFGVPKSYAVGAAPRSVAIGDLSGDGKADLAVPGDGSNTVSVLLNTGAGAFGAATSYAAGGRPFGVLIAKLNTDTRPDLAVANYDTRNVSVLLGTSGGAFGPATNFDAGGSAQAVAAGDLNGDAKLDLAASATLGAMTNDLSVLPGNGAGAFGAPTTFSFATQAGEGLALPDLNGDGKLDAALAGTGSDDVLVALGNGTGGFTEGGRFLVGDAPRFIAVGDFNGDARPDLATANSGSSQSVSVLLNSTGATGCDPALTPVGCWRFNERSGTTALDSSPFHNNGTYVNGPTLGVPGVIPGDTAVSLDGTNDFVRVPDAPSLDVGDSFSLEGWILRDSTAKGHQLFSKGTKGFQVVVQEQTNGNRVLLRKAGGATVARSSGGVPADGHFHHVVVTKDGKTAQPQIFIDGVQQTLLISQPAQVIENTTQPLSFSAGTSAGNPIRGDIDQFAIYDRALTAAQAAALFAAGHP